jgi:hypothetical protein
MKMISKTISLLFLVTLTLASCGGFTSPPAGSPTDKTETAAVETQAAIPTVTPTPITPTSIPPTQTPFFSIPFDRHDPEAVLRAYFDAWNRNDWTAKNSLLGQERAPEPVDSVRVIEIELISSSPTEFVYRVQFELRVKGEGVSMHSGKYGWKYYLTWDANRDSWLITNYGYW